MNATDAHATDAHVAGAQPADAGRGGAETPALPVISVTRGRATDAEVAAVTAVLLAVRSAGVAAAAAAADAERPRSSRWAESSRVRPWLSRPGPQAWRASALPR